MGRCRLCTNSAGAVPLAASLAVLQLLVSVSCLHATLRSSFTSSVTAAGVRAVPTYNAASLAVLQLLVPVPCLRATVSSSFSSGVTAAGVRVFARKTALARAPAPFWFLFWLHFSSIWLSFRSIWLPFGSISPPLGSLLGISKLFKKLVAPLGRISPKW